MIVGLDEVGRGPFAGPLLVAAVALGEQCPSEIIDMLDDSKRLSEQKRSTLAKEIRQHAAVVALSWVSPQRIDDLGLAESLKTAFLDAAKDLANQNGDEIEFIVDGPIDYLSELDYSSTAVVAADSKFKEVSAASIIAKDTRDRYMRTLHHLVDDRYQLDRNKGYGTAAHRASIADYGKDWFHRQSFMINKERQGAYGG